MKGEMIIGLKIKEINNEFVIVIAVGFTYNENNYFYVRNLLQEIVFIVNEQSQIVGEYYYDAYGNILNLDELTDIAKVNSIRYKGYYYEDITQLFYCNSRYYSPELCRWISPDSIEYLDPSSINGLNLYCYCLNNPIMFSDPSGHSAVLVGLIIGAIIGAGLGFGTATYIDYQDDEQIFNGSVAWYDYLGATVLGGAAGAVVGAVIGNIAPQIGGALSSFAAQEFTFGAYTYITAGGELMISAGVTITGSQILNAAGLLGATYMFAKGGLPNNKYQNKQWTEAMRRLGIDDRDLWRRLHNEIQKHPYNTHDTLKKLMELLKEILKKWGKL